MSTQASRVDVSPATNEVQVIARLARESSIELNIPDVNELRSSRDLLWPGQKVYVSHMPRQTWAQTLQACRAVAAAGFDPVPHIPVRLLKNERELDDLLAQAVGEARAQEVLLISGDYSAPAGPYSTVRDALRSAKLEAHGLKRVSLAGHPEGHPTVPSAEMRRAEIEKASIAAQSGFVATTVTQFFFESRPFTDWAFELRAAGVNSRLIAGLAGPANIGTLLRFARRCGVGPSIRALSCRPGQVVKLITEHHPDIVLRDLAGEWQRQRHLFDGIHLFCFGGFLRTAEWLHRVADGRIRLDDGGGFSV